MDDDFDNVTWQNDPDSEAISPGQDEYQASSSRPDNGKRRDSGTMQAGHNADAVDLAGVEDGRLDCTVDTPLKEGDGNNAYVSYLVTTQVRTPESSH